MAEEQSSMEQRYQKIWQAVAAIPAGRVMSYGQVAAAAGMPRRARFVSKALKEAPDDLQLPWYRVIRSDGSIAFPAGTQAHRKQARLLKAEGVEVKQGKVRLKPEQQVDDLDFLLWSGQAVD